MKKGFILYLDSLSVLDELNDEQTAILFRAIRDYNLGKEPELDFAMKMAFLPFKNQFIRHNEDYEKTCERNRNNGLKGGRPKKPKETKKTEKTEVVFEKPKKADKDTDTDTDINSFNVFWNIYDKKSDRAKCLKAWLNIHPHKHGLIYEQARKYVQSTPDSKYRKNPLTWLNGQCWEDEIKTETKTEIFDPLVEYCKKLGIQ